MRRIRGGTQCAVVVAAAVALAADATTLAAGASPSIRLDRLPATQLAKCTKSKLLPPACPRVVPRVAGGYRALLARDGKLKPALHVFDLERFAPSLQPPEGAHITVVAGAVQRLTPYADPTARSPIVPVTHPVNVNRTQPVSFGLRTWNGRRGLLYLAPPYIHGGQLGDHIVFQWRQGGTSYAIPCTSGGHFRRLQQSFRQWFWHFLARSRGLGGAPLFEPIRLGSPTCW